jgi:hypothetical protein
MDGIDRCASGSSPSVPRSLCGKEGEVSAITAAVQVSHMISPRRSCALYRCSSGDIFLDEHPSRFLQVVERRC